MLRTKITKPKKPAVYVMCVSSFLRRVYIRRDTRIYLKASRSEIYREPPQQPEGHFRDLQVDFCFSSSCLARRSPFNLCMQHPIVGVRYSLLLSGRLSAFPVSSWLSLVSFVVVCGGCVVMMILLLLTVTVVDSWGNRVTISSSKSVTLV